MSAVGEGSTPAEALVACGVAQEAALAALRTAGAVAVRTQGVTVHAEWDQQRGGLGDPRGTSELSARLPDRAAAGAAVTAALSEAGPMSRLHSLSPVVSDPSASLVQARRLAYDDARATAQQYADHAGAVLGPLLSLSEGEGVRHMPTQRMAGHLESAMSSYLVVQADSDVTVTVVATWELID